MRAPRLAALCRSFACAGRGLWRALRAERNLRIHLAATALVFSLAPFYPFDRGDWALLFLACGLVWGAELLNTAVERLCDRVCSDRDRAIGWVKDAAAGGVLACAVFAAGAGICLFGDPAGLCALGAAIATPLGAGAALALLAALGLFVLCGGERKDDKTHF
ncbi:diacylglycerol kinase family protein [Bittarella massiliensis (ex Durand et al. 2017)]|mgnify:FL=1|uniref:diacylglycerol kinase family protein n=1 Tax=Bittarella massiliensis (ex Durand et al. 2017) TaxID=1720313 RepID=UPI001AA0DA5A|nr:diacylglycerol kinase family protein [Bittarella massiliensis (ex Durand et al. 2017)]